VKVQAATTDVDKASERRPYSVLRSGGCDQTSKRDQRRTHPAHGVNPTTVPEQKSCAAGKNSQGEMSIQAVADDYLVVTVV